MAGLACVAEQRVYGVPADTGHRIFEASENVRHGPGVRMLVEELETASAHHGALVRESPDDGVDLLLRKPLAAVLACTAAARGHRVSSSVALGRDLEAIDHLEVRVHERPPRRCLIARTRSTPGDGTQGRV